MIENLFIGGRRMQKAASPATLSKTPTWTACGDAVRSCSSHVPLEKTRDEDAQVFYPCAPPYPYRSRWDDSPTHGVSVLSEKVLTSVVFRLFTSTYLMIALNSSSSANLANSISSLARALYELSFAIASFRLLYTPSLSLVRAATIAFR